MSHERSYTVLSCWNKIIVADISGVNRRAAPVCMLSYPGQNSNLHTFSSHGVLALKLSDIVK